MVTGKMTGVASYGYYVSSRIPAMPPKLVKEWKSADDFVLQMLELGLEYRYHCSKPRPIVMRAEDHFDFDTATQCYMCSAKLGSEGCKALLRDHDHFTGAYRGASCHSCNVKARCPPYIVVFFHKLSKFDSHEILLAIARLRNNILPDGYGDEEPPRKRVAHGGPSSSSCACAREQDFEEIEQNPNDEEADMDGSDSEIGPDTYPDFGEFVGDIVDVGTEPQARWKLNLRRRSTLKFKVLAKSSEESTQIQFGPVVLKAFHAS